jgi:hypothetical protein
MQNQGNQMARWIQATAPAAFFFIRTMKLQQSQVWKQGGKYFRIVRLERLEVDYKAMKSPNSKKGTHHQASKKEFCRLLKNATLLTDTEIWSAPPQ